VRTYYRANGRENGGGVVTVCRMSSASPKLNSEFVPTQGGAQVSLLGLFCRPIWAGKVVGVAK